VNQRNVGKGSFVINECDEMHEISEEYNNDDLSFDVDSDEGLNFIVQKYTKYKPEDMHKSFKFKLGMEFCSLKDFNHALMEHNVLNSKEVKFVKNVLVKNALKYEDLIKFKDVIKLEVKFKLVSTKSLEAYR